ncbi:MAG: hypothetical protein E6124_21795, partial [Blautia producta]|nr:hypothetical protein [Blautia producta]MDU5384804.1 hypothetical protein [Blautia producta]MDU6885527.1 hypothetical protein [Blautia producta]
AWVPTFMVVHSAQVYIQLKPLFSRHNGIGVQFTDEPTGNLDSKTELEVISLLKACVNEYGQTLIMITHDETIAQMADRILVIEDGKVVSQ